MIPILDFKLKYRKKIMELYKALANNSIETVLSVKILAKIWHKFINKDFLKLLKNKYKNGLKNAKYKKDW